MIGYGPWKKKKEKQRARFNEESRFRCSRCRDTKTIQLFNGDPDYYFFETIDCPECVK